MASAMLLDPKPGDVHNTTAYRVSIMGAVSYHTKKKANK
jgi:hypothetical protein